MSVNHFLLLTKSEQAFGKLFLLTKELQSHFNFVIHSVEKEDENHFDLRNFKLIKTRLNDDTILIFYLTEELSLFVINQLIRNCDNLNRKIFFLSSLFVKYYPRRHASFITDQNCRELLNRFFPNVVFINSSMREDDNSKHINTLNLFGEERQNSIELNLDAVIRTIMNQDEIFKSTEKEFLFIQNSYKSFIQNNYTTIKRNISRHLYNPANYLFGKERRIYLKALSGILGINLENENVITVENNLDMFEIDKN